VLKTFPRGGVHPAENKFSAGNKIIKMALPKIVTIPLAQHLGVPAEVLVNRGDQVKTGQAIGASKGFVSSNIHSSVTGKVIKVDKSLDSSGYKKTAVTIEVTGDEWLPEIDRSSDLKNEITISGKEIIKKTLEAGIVGMGGATFPSHVKMSVPKGKKAEIVILNGVECEPFLTSDHRLMLEKGEEILVGLRLIMKALGVTKGMVGIENNKKDAIDHFSQLSKQYTGIEVFALKVKYPQGGEKQLIKALTGKEVPSGGLPIDVGVVVHNVGTAFAVYEAIQKNKPLIERVVTVSGKNVNAPSNLLARIGTPIKLLIEASGGIPENTGKIINGGPMMGKAMNSVEVPVMKGTSGILLIPDKESSREKINPCIRCSKCITVCPMGLEPYLLMTLTEKEKYDKLEEDKVMDCIECGSCSYTCPANRPLLDYIRLGKFNLGQIIRNRK